MAKAAAILLRQSTRNPGSESLDVQERVCRRKAAELGVNVVAFASDPAVSGFKVHPFERPKLRKVFDRADEYEILIYYKQSRFIRHLIPDFSDMVVWATKHDVQLVSATQQLSDPRDHLGVLLPMLTAWMDEGTVRQTQETLRDLYAHVRSEGRWGGGKAPYGYMSVPIGLKQHALAIDEAAAAVIREAVARVLQGESLNAICADFNRRGIPSPYNRARQLHDKPMTATGKWQSESLSLILQSPAMLGYLVHNRELLRHPDGSPVVAAPPLIDEDVRESVKLMLAERRPYHRSENTSLLLQIAICLCGSPYYRWTSRPRGKVYAYYKCLKQHRPDKYPEGCLSKMVRVERLDGEATEMFLSRVGHVEITSKMVIGDDSHIKRIDALGKRIIALTTAELEQDVDHSELLATLRAERTQLRAMEVPKPEIREVGTGRTFAEEWAERDDAGRRLLMLAAGFRFVYARLPDGGYVRAMAVDDGLAERAQLAASGEVVAVPASKLEEAVAPLRAVLNRPRLVRRSSQPGV